MPKLLEEIEELMKMNEDDLRELLIEDKYNKANLRYQLRQCLDVANRYKRLYERQKETGVNDKKEQLLNTISMVQKYVANELELDSDELMEELEKHQNKPKW